MRSDPWRDPVVEAYKRDIDVSLLIENLKRSPEERLRRLMALQAFAEELRAAGARARLGQRSFEDGEPT